MEAIARCPKCNARGSWLQRIGWDNVNKVWEYGCVLCGYRPPMSRPRSQSPVDEASHGKSFLGESRV
ncbi:MAG: hypothetical protein ACYC3S_15030 [Chloroflexota bacterium]